jgi:hypothetical protein
MSEALQRPILEQTRLRAFGLSKHISDPSVSQWKLPENYAERLLKFPTPTSMAFLPPSKVVNSPKSRVKSADGARQNDSESPETSSEAPSNGSENAELRYDFSKVEKQGRRLAMQYVVAAAHRMRRRLDRHQDADEEDVDIALVDIRGLPTKEGLRQALIARAGSLRRAYKIFDSKNTGHVTFQKFLQGLKHFQINTFNLLGKEAKDVFMEFDDDASGDLSLIELIGFYSEADEELLRITADGFLPGRLLWTRYINEVNSQKTTLNRQPCWDPRRFRISQIEELLEAYKKQREFEKHTQELRRQLRESSDLDRQRVIDALNPAKQPGNNPVGDSDSSVVVQQPTTPLDTNLHERIQRIANLVRSLSSHRKEMRGIISEATDVMNMRPFAPDVSQELLGPFGIPMRDVELLRALFELYKNKMNLLPKEGFKKFTKNITLDEVVPARQYHDWWNFMSREKFVDFTHILVWYSHFVLFPSCVLNTTSSSLKYLPS